MGLAGMVFSIISITLGAILCWAVTAQSHGFRLSTLGVILMVVGAVSLIISTVIFATCREPSVGRNRIFDRRATDTLGRTTSLHEELS